MLRKGIGIDIGTTQISICTIEGGLLLKEPNVAALEIDSDRVVAVGQEALQAVKEAPAHLQLCWPAWDGVVKYAGVLSVMLRTFLRRALGHTLLRPQVMVSIPCDLTETQINAVEDAMLAAGAARVHLLEAPLCAALGVGLDFSVPVGQMLVHIGATRTEAAVIFLGDMVAHKTAHVGGVQFDTAIVNGKIYADGKLQKGDKFQACVFANGRYYGGGYFAAPAAEQNDGIIDCCIIDKIPLTTFLKILGDYKAGKHLTNPKIPKVFAYRKAKTVEIFFERPTDISVDGEIERIKGKLTISSVHNAVTLATPKACQPIPVDTEVMKSAHRFNKR